MESLSLYDASLQLQDPLIRAANVTAFLTGTQANRPVTAQSGTLYIPTDANYESVYNGSSWDTYVDGFKCGKPPLISTMSGINITSITNFVAYGDSWLVTQSGSGGTMLWAGYVTALPSPPYKLEIGFDPQYIWPSSWAGFGPALMNAATVTSPAVEFRVNFGSSGYPSLTGGKLNNVTSWNSAYFEALYNTPPYTRDRFFLRLRDDGTTRFYENSADGVNWNIFYTVGRTDLTTPNYGSILIHQSTNTRAVTDMRTQFKVFHWYLGI